MSTSSWAHMDGWFDAALDNASGLSTMLTLAEYSSGIPKETRRDLREDETGEPELPAEIVRFS